MGRICSRPVFMIEGLAVDVSFSSTTVYGCPGRVAASHAAEIRYPDTFPYSEYSQQQLKMVREISAVLCSST
jgi:hypothetical protein